MSNEQCGPICHCHSCCLCRHEPCQCQLNITSAEYSKLVGYPEADERCQGLYLQPEPVSYPDDYLDAAEDPNYADIIAHLGVQDRSEVCILWATGQEPCEIWSADPYLLPGWVQMPSEGAYTQKGLVNINGKPVPAVAFQDASPVAFFIAAKDLVGLHNVNTTF